MSSTIPIPATQNAVVIQDSRHIFTESVPVPSLGASGILVRVKAVAINPVDAKMIDLHGADMHDCVGGYDFAGYIIAMGPELQEKQRISRRFGIGDRVAGIVLGNNPLEPRVGAFCEYALADARFLIRLRDTVKFEEGASLGVAVAAVGMALYQSLRLELPSLTGIPNNTSIGDKESSEQWALVLGGSTSCGTMAIQMLKLSGYKVIATCSAKHQSLARSYGADHTVDYYAATCASELKERTGNSLKIALDCVSDNESFQMCYEALGATGGKYTGLNPFPIRLHSRSDVKPHWVFILTMFGQSINLKGPFNRPQPRTKDVDFEKMWFEMLQRLLDLGLVRTHPVKTMEQGLEGVPEGINQVRLGMASGERLVYSI